MAIEYVDSTQLDSDLTSVANAIRAKSGGSGQLAFPAGFVSEIQAIPSGGDGSWVYDVNKLQIGLRGATISDDLVLDFSGKTITLSTFLVYATATNDNTSVEIKAYSCGEVQNIGQSCTKIRTLRYTTDVSPIAGSQFVYSTSLYKILGTPIKLYTLGSGASKRINSSSLNEIYFLPNTCTTGGDGVTTGVLIDASLVSLANALKAVSSQTIKLTNATTKAKCSTIMGTVSQVTEGGETYDFFTQDASGTVTLADFITTTKGWTLA